MFARSIIAKSFKLQSITQSTSLRALTPKPIRSSFAVRTFSLSAYNRSQGLVDKDLSHKLNEEIQHEGENEAFPSDFLKKFNKLGIWKIEDIAGSKEIKLTRTFGSEKISILSNIGSLSEKNFENIVDEEAEEVVDQQVQIPARFTAVIEKKAGGALEISASIRDSSIFIDNISHIASVGLAVDSTSEADWQRKNYYSPLFEDLDESVIDLFDKYLEERGIDDTLADFIPQYLQWKEQNEYKLWLKNVTKFISL
ncbi:Mitochondrial acidic protein mam33 [Nowakowskiella sp. JEL0078]|nr:Mitochondrial acidic protein mam33 [Nowakowskiella sp. JEL0078]